jgi:hypothetical protein
MASAPKPTEFLPLDGVVLDQVHVWVKVRAIKLARVDEVSVGNLVGGACMDARSAQVQAERRLHGEPVPHRRVGERGGLGFHHGFAEPREEALVQHNHLKRHRHRPDT